jgi:hypothetical protein
MVLSVIAVVVYSFKYRVKVVGIEVILANINKINS